MGTYSWNLSHFLQWVISLLLMLFLFVLLSRWGIKREHGVLFCDVTHVTLMPLPKILSFGFYAVEFLAWLWNSTHPTKGCNPIRIDSLGTIATWWRVGRGMPGMSWAEGLKGQLCSELSKPWGPSMRHCLPAEATEVWKESWNLAAELVLKYVQSTWSFRSVWYVDTSQPMNKEYDPMLNPQAFIPRTCPWVYL